MTITSSQRALILESLAVGVDLPHAAKAAGTTAAAVRRAMAAEGSEGEALARDVAAAVAEGERAAAAALAVPPPPPVPVGAMGEAWAGVVAASAEAQRPDPPTPSPAPLARRPSPVALVTPGADAPESPTPQLTPEDRAAWEKVRREAAAFGPGRIGQLLWIDDRCQKAGLRALDPWWIWHFDSFYESGKRVDKMRGGLRLGKSSTACEAIINTLIKPHDIDAGTVAIVPIMSIRREEADDRFYTLVKILSACGMEPKKPDERTGTLLGGGFGGQFNHARNALSGGGQIRLRDSQGHDVEIRCFPARLAATRGPTCFSFFCDEVDGWLDDEELHANPAPLIVEGLMERTTTQPETEAFIYSANYRGAGTYHSNLIDKGDTRSDYVARLGPLGAERDTEARLSLATLIGSTDERLLKPADPGSVDIPAWVGNPKATIETCYELAKEDIGRMLGRYGGRATENRAAAVGGGGGCGLAADLTRRWARMRGGRGAVGGTVL